MYNLLLADGQRKEYTLLALKRSFERNEIHISDVAQKHGETGWRTVGEILGEYTPTALGSAARKFTVPLPPPVTSQAILSLCAVTCGLILLPLAVVHGAWSCRIRPRVTPILYPLLAILAPLATITWAVISVVHESRFIGFLEQDTYIHFWRAFLMIPAGLVLSLILSVSFTALGSLAVRKTIMDHLRPSGFKMSWFVTALLGPIHVQYKLDEIRNLYT